MGFNLQHFFILKQSCWYYYRCASFYAPWKILSYQLIYRWQNPTATGKKLCLSERIPLTNFKSSYAKRLGMNVVSNHSVLLNFLVVSFENVLPVCLLRRRKRILW